jgi:hypothetical protein
MVRGAKLDDWAGVKSLWEKFSKSKHAKRIPGDLATIEKYFATAMVDSRIGFPVIAFPECLRGFAIVHEATSPDLNESAMALAHNMVAFLRVVHILPGSQESADEMHTWLNDWAKAHKCAMLQGYCCLDFPLQAYDKLHNIRPLWYVVGKDVT